MQKKILIGSIASVIILILVSFTSVVGYNSVESDVKDSPLFNIRLIEPYKLNNLNPKTINLTAEQYNTLKQYFVMFRERLNNTLEYDKIVKLYIEALTELADLHIIPRDSHFNLVKNLLLQKNPNLRSTLAPNDDDFNILALISGSVTGPGNFLPPLYLILNIPAYALLWIILAFSGTYNMPLLLYAMLIIGSIAEFILNVNTYSPFSFFNNIEGPTKGWVHSLGLNGIKQWSGNLTTKPLFFSVPIIIGFTGYKILDKQNGKHFFIGTCLYVRIHVF